MKKTVILLLILFVTAASLYSFDFGGNLDDSTIDYYSSGNSIFHSDTLSGWFSADITDSFSFYVLGNIAYTTDNQFLFDLDMFKVEAKGSSRLGYTIGRFNISDFSGYVVNQKIDGAMIVLNYPGFIVKTEAGYTGLLFNRSSGIEMTLSDQADKSGLLDLESSRIIAGAEAVFPELLDKYDIKAGLWTQFDLRSDGNLVSGGGKLNTQYLGVSIGGPILSNLYFDSFAYLGTGKMDYAVDTRDYTVLSFLGSAGLRYYIEDFHFSKLTFRFLYSSGDSDYKGSFLEGNTADNSSMFTAVSSKPSGLVFSPSMGNIMFSRLSYSIKPLSDLENSVLSNIQMELTDLTYFRSTAGAISESGINGSSDSLYLGTEIDGTVNFRPYSDLGVSVSTGVFIPNNGTDGAFTESLRGIEFLARAGISFSF